MTITFRPIVLDRGHVCAEFDERDAARDARVGLRRVSAAGILLDRGWRRASQPHDGEDGKDMDSEVIDRASLTDGSVGLCSFRLTVY